jgi:hypothetical protein
VTTKTQLSFVNGADFDVRLELNSGLTAAHNSAIRFTDRNFDRWDIIKNNGNALIVFDIPNSVSLLELDPTDVIQMRGPLVMATAGGIVPFATTVASLPACSTGGTLKGAIFNVTDANATTFNAVAAGGGSNFMQVVCDGTSWRLH